MKYSFQVPEKARPCHVPVLVTPGKGLRNACVKKRMTRIESRRIFWVKCGKLDPFFFVVHGAVEQDTDIRRFAGKSGAMYTLYGKFEAWRFACSVQ